jgi:hypothetical protein
LKPQCSRAQVKAQAQSEPGEVPLEPAAASARPHDEGPELGPADYDPDVHGSEELVSLPPWHDLSLDDLRSFRPDLPLASDASADCQRMSHLYRAAADAEAETEAVRKTYALIADALGMHFSPESRHEPFGPMLVLPGGRRSAFPSDFSICIDVLQGIAVNAANPALRARMADLCCLLDRKRSAMAFLAMTAYAELVECVDRGALTFPAPGDQGAPGRDACDHLRLALFIGLAPAGARPRIEATPLSWTV